MSQLLLVFANALMTRTSNPVNTNQTGTSYKIIDVPDGPDQTWAFEVQILTLAAGTNPTAKIVFETSSDGVGWWTAAESTVQTGAGSLSERKALPATGIGRYIRARLVLGGDVNGNALYVVNLVSDRTFKLLAA